MKTINENHLVNKVVAVLLHLPLPLLPLAVAVDVDAAGSKSIIIMKLWKPLSKFYYHTHLRHFLVMYRNKNNAPIWDHSKLGDIVSMWILLASGREDQPGQVSSLGVPNMENTLMIWSISL